MTKINLKNVYLNYPVLGGDSRSFKKNLFRKFNKNKFFENNEKIIHVQALKGINLKIQEGEKIGLYGKNGSGKTTLLKIINKIFKPTSGEVSVSGKINSLIEFNSGMSEHLTGLENIIFRLRLLGLKKVEIDEKITQIIEFSELKEFIYLPLKMYSSGMRMRLGFTILTCIHSDITLMDEWLSVGDVDFQKKAELKLKSIISETKILILASQNLNQLKKVCDKILHLKDGIIIEEL